MRLDSLSAELISAPTLDHRFAAFKMALNAPENGIYQIIKPQQSQNYCEEIFENLKT